jgi:hypothetical protein
MSGEQPTSNTPHLSIIIPGRNDAEALPCGPWRTFLLIVWLLLLHTLRFDTQRDAERWRGPANRPPGSPWPHRHPHQAGGAAQEGDC